MVLPLTRLFLIVLFQTVKGYLLKATQKFHGNLISRKDLSWIGKTHMKFKRVSVGWTTIVATCPGVPDRDKVQFGTKFK